MKYTIQQIEHLAKVRLNSFKEDDMMDDYYCNDYGAFSNYVNNKFISWLKKMEEQGKIEYLLTLQNKEAEVK